MENQQQASPPKAGTTEPLQVACEESEWQPLLPSTRPGTGKTPSERVVRVAGGWEVFHPLGDEVTVCNKMGFFKSKKSISKKPVEEWGREEVQKWLNVLGMQRYEEKFRAIQGRRLLQLSAADVHQLTASKLDADLLLDAIQELRDQKPSRQSSLKDRFARSLSISSASSGQALFDPSQPNSSNISSAPSADRMPTPEIHQLREAEPAMVGTSPFAMARPSHDGPPAAPDTQQAPPAQLHHQDENAPAFPSAAFQNGGAAQSRTAENGNASNVVGLQNGARLPSEPLSHNGAAEPQQPPSATSHMISYNHLIPHSEAALQQEQQQVTTSTPQASNTGSLLTSGNVMRHEETAGQGTSPLQPTLGQHHWPPPISHPANECIQPSADLKSPARSQTSSPSRPSSPVPSLVRQSVAESLHTYLSTNQLVTDLVTYLKRLGIQGVGLVEATERSPVIGHIIGAVWDLSDMAPRAKANKANCQQLSAYTQDMLRIFELKGKQLAFLNGSILEQLLQQVEAANGIVDACTKPGWLVAMACNERSIESFVAVHNSILEILRAHRMDTMSNGRTLTFGDYHDISRPLRRFLKQLGSGSLDEGLRIARFNEKQRRELAKICDLDEQVLLRELDSAEGIPQALMETTTSCEVSEDSPSVTTVKSQGTDYRSLFWQYDKAGQGALSFEDMVNVIQDLGLLNGATPNEALNIAQMHFSKADGNKDGQISFDEFERFHQATTDAQARKNFHIIVGQQAAKDLFKIFCAFASFGTRQNLEEMDSSMLNKLCRDCKLMGRGLTTTQVELTFASVKLKGRRRINFEQFTDALSLFAEKRGQDLRAIVDLILSSHGPQAKGTQPDFVKFHDDKTTYTGVYARGGPTNVEQSQDLSAYLDRSSADVRGVKRQSSVSQNDPPPLDLRSSLGGAASPATASPATPPSISTPGHRASFSFGRVSSPATPTMRASTSSFKSPAPLSPSDQSLQAVFIQFASFGSGTGPRDAARVEMDGARLVKLCREAGLIGGKVNTTSVDIIFSKVKTKGSRKISFSQFLVALDKLAAERGWDAAEARSCVSSCMGPTHTNTTTAAAVRLHDDRSTYTGVYAKGGPSTVDKRITLESLTDRTNQPGDASSSRMNL
ncbi:hypothetical protein WJX74_008620 [Apatococcus lobatus]|uniref:Uncharacterized protein n=1 Tax=Apatococcus lobatus TaxID=904363 RepID=A0AAW1QIW7_9CHLO